MNPNPWSYSYIRALAEEATERAKLQGLRPTLAAQAFATWKRSCRFNIPFLGDHVPDGWVRADDQIVPFFVDRTGRARPGENNCITAYEFYRRLEAWRDTPFAFGVIEAGQTQALVAAYEKE